MNKFAWHFEKVLTHIRRVSARDLTLSNNSKTSFFVYIGLPSSFVGMPYTKVATPRPTTTEAGDTSLEAAAAAAVWRPKKINNYKLVFSITSPK
jgi:hypothetical protein